jgi:biopolymer transport protein ExbB
MVTILENENMYWIILVEWFARIIFVLLIFLSIWSIALILERRKIFKELMISQSFWENILVEGQRDSLKKAIEKNPNGNVENFWKKLLLAGNDKTTIQLAYEIYVQELKSKMEKSLAVLGTLGSTSPFIGLLGTVMGIIVSFGKLSMGAGEGNTNAVMFSLSEALVLTAVGLLVAIPAVISFNYFSKKLKNAIQDLNLLKDQYIFYFIKKLDQ